MIPCMLHPVPHAIDVELARQFLKKYQTAILDDLLRYYSESVRSGHVTNGERSITWTLFPAVGHAAQARYYLTTNRMTC